MWHIECKKSCGGREKYEELGSCGPERKGGNGNVQDRERNRRAGEWCEKAETKSPLFEGNGRGCISWKRGRLHLSLGFTCCRIMRKHRLSGNAADLHLAWTLVGPSHETKQASCKLTVWGHARAVISVRDLIDCPPSTNKIYDMFSPPSQCGARRGEPKASARERE